MRGSRYIIWVKIQKYNFELVKNIFFFIAMLCLLVAHDDMRSLAFCIEKSRERGIYATNEQFNMKKSNI